MKNIVIIGASGHGSVVQDCIENEGTYNVVGFIDSFKRKGKLHNGKRVLGTENDLPRLKKKFDLQGGIVAIGDNWTRKQLVQKINQIVPNFVFVTAVHPSANIGKDVYIGQGTVVMPGAVINACSVVGDFCIINTNASLGHDGTLDDYSSLASGVRTGGNFSLGICSAVSIGAIVIENITVLAHTIVGAGSLVLKNITNNVVAYGCPAKVIRARTEGEQYLSGSVDSKIIPFESSIVEKFPLYKT